MNFKTAIVRKPGSNFADGLTTVDLGIPEYSKVLAQHAAYCVALRVCGLELIELEADLRYPDSTFVEDTAVLTRASAIFTHPGAASREGEVEAIRPVVARFFARTHALTAPGTLDGGDICEAENHFFIGLSERTNEEGARQLAAFLAAEGCTSSCVSIHGVPGILHFKSGVTYIGGNTILAIDALAERPELKGLQHRARRPRGSLRRQLRAHQRSCPHPRRLPAPAGRVDPARLQSPAPGNVRISKDGRRPELLIFEILITESKRCGSKKRI